MANREAVAGIADVMVAKKELYGDEVVGLLDAADPEAPAIDILDDEAWPRV